MSEVKSDGFVGRSIPRKEDQRLLTGKGQFVADLKLPGMLHAAFVRSQVAHARIKSIDLSRALKAPGVVYAIAGPELAQMLPPVPDTQLSLPRKWTTRVQHKFQNPQQPLLSYDKVRHVGEAVAVILAETRYQAEDAAELVEVDLEPLPAVVDPIAGLTPESAVLHEQYGTNLIGDFVVEKGDVQKALAAAPRRIKRRFHHHRYAGIPMECRGVVGSHDPRTDTMTIWSACQVVHWLKREASTVLNMPEARIRCIALDVGGDEHLESEQQDAPKEASKFRVGGLRIVMAILFVEGDNDCQDKAIDNDEDTNRLDDPRQPFDQDRELLHYGIPATMILRAGTCSD